MKNICFVSPYSIATFRNYPNGMPIGGAEVQQKILACKLVEKGYHVNFIVLFDGIKGTEVIDGIRFFKLNVPNIKSKVFKNIGYIMVLLYSLYKSKSDVFYCRGARHDFGVVALFCIIFNKIYIQSIAHNKDCEKDSITYIKSSFKKKIFQFGLKRAHLVLSQTKHQQSKLINNFNIKSVLVKNAVKIENNYINTDCLNKRNAGKLNVLWVGTIKPIKRPEYLLQLAKKLSYINFTVIGSRVEYYNSLYETFVSDVAKLKNIKHLEYVPVNKINRYFKVSDILLCTSSSEGFPNTFLQSWVNGRIVVSTFDPDNIIQQNNLGFYFNNMSCLTNKLIELAGAERFILDLLGVASKNYVINNHSDEIVVNQLIQLINEIQNR